MIRIKENYPGCVLCNRGNFKSFIIRSWESHRVWYVALPNACMHLAGLQPHVRVTTIEHHGASLKSESPGTKSRKLGNEDEGRELREQKSA